MKKVVALILLMPFFLKAQKANFGLKIGFIYAKDKNLNFFQNLKNNPSNLPISNKGWLVGAFYNFKFQRFLIKNELFYNQFSNYFQSDNNQDMSFKNYSIAYGLIPAIRIQKYLDLHTGIVSYLNLRRKIDLQAIESMNFNKFNLGLLIGGSFYTSFKINIDLSLEIPLTKYETKYSYNHKSNPIKNTPYLVKTVIGYCIN